MSGSRPVGIISLVTERKVAAARAIRPVHGNFGATGTGVVEVVVIRVCPTDGVPQPFRRDERRPGIPRWMAGRLGADAPAQGGPGPADHGRFYRRPSKTEALSVISINGAYSAIASKARWWSASDSPAHASAATRMRTPASAAPSAVLRTQQSVETPASTTS